MNRILLLALAGLLSACASAPPAGHYRKVPAEDQERFVQDMCQKVTCVNNLRVVIKQSDGSVFDKTFDSMPVVQPEGVSVYAGQTVLFEADIDGDVLTNFKLVDTIQNPQKTFSANLKQQDDGQMVLAMRNPLDRYLRISMGIMRMNAEVLQPTSSCPVVAKGGSYELWPYPIFQVWLGGLRLLKDGDDMTCE